MVHARLIASRYFSAWTDQECIASIFHDVKTVWNPELGFEVGCWIKANQIHRWFVEHVQRNVNNYVRYPITTIQFYNLRAACQQVLTYRHLASQVLPPMEGLYYGQQTIDELYFQQISDTIVMIDIDAFYVGILLLFQLKTFNTVYPF